MNTDSHSLDYQKFRILGFFANYLNFEQQLQEISHRKENNSGLVKMPLVDIFMEEWLSFVRVNLSRIFMSLFVKQ
jgi:hypothetical protein